MKPNRKSRPGHWPAPQHYLVGGSADKETPVSLLLPLDIPSALFDLSKVEHSWKACRLHFGELELDWKLERKGSFGKARAHAVLQVDPRTGGVWTLVVLEAASAGKHVHNGSKSYGEFIATLAGELDDVCDDGSQVRLTAGTVMFHAPGTIHEARAPGFWVGLIHQPYGCTEVV